VILLDSSGWLEMFKGGPNGNVFADRVAAAGQVLVPTIVMQEVYRVMLRDSDEPRARMAAGALHDQLVIALDENTALHSARLGLQHRLASADAIVYATGQLHDAIVVTSDAHFEGLPGVEYVPKR
jgi:toxin FitB